jgi:lysophospholipase L1-like esterase
VGILIILVSFEAYLRSTTTYVTSKNATHGLRLVGSHQEALVEWTARGRRVIPDTHVIIRNHYLSGKDVVMDINSLGFRGADIPQKKKDHEMRILVLGDSITWGAYLQEDEVFVERAQAYLNARRDRRTADFINAGVENIGIEDEISILQEKGLAIQPDVVVLAFYLNDSLHPWDFTRETAGQGWLRRNSVLAETLYRNIKLRLWMKQKGTRRYGWWYDEINQKYDWANKRDDFMRLAASLEDDFGAAWNDASWAVIDKGLDRLQAIAAEHAFDVLVVAFPVSYQVYANFLEDRPQQVMKEKALSRGFHYLDVLPLLRQHRDQDLFFDHCHPREYTNDIIGRAIAEYMAASML